MLILTKIIITETLYSMFIYWLQKNLNLFSLDRKLADKTKRKMIHMLWKECMPDKFYKHICKEKNFLYLKGKNVLQPKVLKIISEFIDEDKSNSYKINLSSYKIILQYVYSNVFPEIYCSTEKRGFELMSNFHIIFKTCKDKKHLKAHWRKIIITMNLYMTKHLRAKTNKH